MGHSDAMSRHARSNWFLFDGQISQTGWIEAVLDFEVTIPISQGSRELLFLQKKAIEPQAAGVLNEHLAIEL
ncbi:MAG: hypothetical protein ACJAWL_002873 [Motiliproteus sp.]|jgi:hypothetical protein